MDSSYKQHLTDTKFSLLNSHISMHLPQLSPARYHVRKIPDLPHRRLTRASAKNANILSRLTTTQKKQKQKQREKFTQKAYIFNQQN